MFRACKYEFPTGKRAYIMGILNYTPDSFSDGGKYNEPQAALARALEMREQGADIIDIGANSTRPGAKILSAREEEERLREVLPVIRDRLGVPVSVDTFYPSCARYALENGAVIINDVSGRVTEETARIIAEYSAGWVITHAPVSADRTAVYPDGVIAGVRKFFLEALETAMGFGLKKEQLCLDPGFGFGKSREDNIELLSKLEWVKIKDIALLAGMSRKRFLDGSDENTFEANRLAVKLGADIIRVHNVPLAVESARRGRE